MAPGRYTRAERVAQVQDLLAQGMSRIRIAVELDLSEHYVSGLVTDPDDVSRRRRYGRLEPEGEPQFVSLSEIPLEERARAAWELCRQTPVEAERWQWLALAVFGGTDQSRVLA